MKDYTKSPNRAVNNPRVIVFIDSQVEDYQRLVNGVNPNALVVFIDSTQDGVVKITDTLKLFNKIAEVHIVSHGSPGSLKLGSTQLNSDNLEHYSKYLQTWSDSLSSSSSILIYGCQVGDGDIGLSFIRRLHQLSKANIAATAKPTGSKNLGGDWNLEINIGKVIASEIFSSAVKETYGFTLGADDTQIDLWYGDNQQFGNIGLPQIWANILGNVSDPDGITSLTYSLNGDPVIPLSIGSDSRRIWSDGDFNVDLAFSDLDGSSVDDEVIITATDSLGNITTKTVVVDYEAGNIWPETYSIDWSSVADIQDVAQVVDGKWAIEGDTFRTVEPGYDRLVAIGETNWDDFEVTAPITLNSNIPGQGGVGFLLRWQGHTDLPSDLAGLQPKSGFKPLGGFGWITRTGLRIQTNVGNSRTEVPFEFQLGVPYNLKMRVETIDANSSLYSLKVWEQGQPEPAEWNLQRADTRGGLQTGSAVLISHLTDASFGDVTITPLSQSANQPPIATVAIVNDPLTGTVGVNTDRTIISQIL